MQPLPAVVEFDVFEHLSPLTWCQENHTLSITFKVADDGRTFSGVEGIDLTGKAQIEKHLNPPLRQLKRNVVHKAFLLG